VIQINDGLNMSALVRFGPLCGLKSDISRGPRSADIGNSCQPLNGNLLIRPFGGGGGRVFRIQSRAQAYVFNVFGWLAEAARG
jgi:hypothetical protein